MQTAHGWSGSSWDPASWASGCWEIWEAKPRSLAPKWSPWPRAKHLQAFVHEEGGQAKSTQPVLTQSCRNQGPRLMVLNRLAMPAIFRQMAAGNMFSRTTSPQKSRTWFPCMAAYMKGHTRTNVHDSSKAGSRASVPALLNRRLAWLQSLASDPAWSCK